MYYIRKNAGMWAIHNNFNGKRRALNENEVQLILDEFPNLKNYLATSRAVTFFRNKIRSIPDLP
jgi:hypothetical protein